MRKSSPICDLKSCFLCRHILPQWAAVVETNKKNQSYKKGETIFKEGEQVKGIYFVYTGTIKIHKKWDEKKDLILRFAKSGEMFGYRGLGHEKIYPVTTTAIEPVTVCFMDLAFFDATLLANHPLTYQLMQFYANELQDAEKRMRNLVHMEVKGRVAETLLLLRKTFGETKEGYIDVLLSRQDIASYAGTTYETLFRIMKDMVKEKMIKVKGKKIFLLKNAGLYKLCEPKR